MLTVHRVDLGASLQGRSGSVATTTFNITNDDSFAFLLSPFRPGHRHGCLQCRDLGEIRALRCRFAPLSFATLRYPLQIIY